MCEVNPFCSRIVLYEVSVFDRKIIRRNENVKVEFLKDRSFIWGAAKRKELFVQSHGRGTTVGSLKKKKNTSPLYAAQQ